MTSGRRTVKLGPHNDRHTPRKRSIQYAAARRFYRWRLWNNAADLIGASVMRHGSGRNATPRKTVEDTPAINVFALSKAGALVPGANSKWRWEGRKGNLTGKARPLTGKVLTVIDGRPEVAISADWVANAPGCLRRVAAHALNFRRSSTTGHRKRLSVPSRSPWTSSRCMIIIGRIFAAFSAATSNPIMHQQHRARPRSNARHWHRSGYRRRCGDASRQGAKRSGASAGR